MGQYYLAVDMGASSGRLLLGHLEEGRILVEEVHRFPNGMVTRGGHLCWEYDKLLDEILTGMKKCAARGIHPVSMGVDTWGVDYVLLSEEGRLVGDTVGYRDRRTEGMEAEVSKVISQEELYERTGILRASYNTIYQLMAQKKQERELLAGAAHLLLVPDYFHYLLSGEMSCEYTEATTTQLLNPFTRDWDEELIASLGFPRQLFGRISQPGSRIGRLRGELSARVGFSLDIVAPASHDTASAVMAVPDETGEQLFISSGTWSLMGLLRKEPDCSPRSRDCNFTNEGGYGGRICYVKNIMGLWMIQSLRKETGEKYSFAQLCDMAAENGDFPSLVDAGSECFLAPTSMSGAIQNQCRRTGQQVPQTTGQLASVIYRSLAESYKKTASELEQITGRQYDSLYIVGGGSQADYLNQLTSDALGKTVYAGPVEATGIGNLLSQMIAKGEVASLEEGKRIIRRSFPVKTYRPGN